MAKYVINDATLTGIASAIREKAGSAEPIRTNEMAEKIRGINVGLDTSDATVTENDMPMGVTGYARGKKLTGNVTLIDETMVLSDAPPTWWDGDDGGVAVAFSAQNGRVMLDPEADIVQVINKNKFGDAADADVTEGKTYTSENGLKRTGTKQDPVPVTQATPTITVDDNGLITAKSTQGAGLVSAGTTQATKQLPTLPQYLYVPREEMQVIKAGQYLAGDQRILGDPNFKEENIRKDVTLFGKLGTFAGSGDGLPAGITALASGTYTPAQDYTTRVDVPHGLGVKPNFFVVMLEQDVSTTMLPNTLVVESVMYKLTKPREDSSVIYTVHIMMEGYGSTNQISGSVSRAAAETYFTESTFGIQCNSTYKLMNGQKYHWVCGILDGVL